jgi:membrane protease subunit (stomatin/prohibitin family)
MAFFDGIRRQLRSVIEWENPGQDELFTRWTDNGDEIKNASKLIVGPGQGCIFVYEGRIRAITVKEGMTDLKTDNIPFWTTISRIMQSFESEHKVGIFYFKRTKILDQKWGTTSSVKYNDPVYKFPVGLRAFGNYSFRITNPESFFVNVIGGADTYTAGDFRSVMVDRIIQPLSDFLAEAKFSYGDIDANREEIAQGIAAKLQVDFEKLGFEITDFRVEGTGFDEDTMRRINRIADMTAEAQAAQAVGLNYAQVQQLDAMKDAAKNEGGGAGMGMGLGAGIGFGQMMAGVMGNNMTQPQQPQQTQQPNTDGDDSMARLQKAKKLLDAGLITQQEYDEKKAQILNNI